MKKRLAAEWEPIKGVMIVWPLFLPKDYVMDLIQNYKVYLCCPSDEESKRALTVLERWGAKTDNIKICVGPQGYDAPWVRDWGMHPVFDEEHNFVLTGAEYQMSTPFVSYEDPEVIFDHDHQLMTTDSYEREEDKAQAIIAEQMGYHFQKLPYALTGGNIMSDGHDLLMSMHVINTENRMKGIEDKDFFDKVKQDTGMGSYEILSNYADFGLQHIDCFLKLLDEERMIVSRPPKNHPLYQRYRKLVENEIKKIKTRYGRNFKIYPLDIVPFMEGSQELCAYANSVILDKCVYVPLYGIPQDEIALEQWKDAMPGYEIKGFTFEWNEQPLEIKNITDYERTGWGYEDVMHCRTRAVWDDEMLYLSVKRANETLEANEDMVISVQIVDYSKMGLIEESLKLYYRMEGEAEWHYIPLCKTSEAEIYEAVINGLPGKKIEYYVEAESLSGRCERMPRVAPDGFYFSVFKKLES